MIYNLCEELLQSFKYFTAKGARIEIFSLFFSEVGHKCPTVRGSPRTMAKDLLVPSTGWRDPQVMFYIRTGTLLPTLTPPGHGARACTHTLTPVTACYSPINSTVRNEPMCH